MRTSPTRLLVALATAITLLTGLTGTLSPASAHTSPAAVYPNCTIPGCAAARDANMIWGTQLHYPAARRWFPWPTGQSNFSGGVFGNREHQLPAGGDYAEYDVFPRRQGSPRDAHRIVLDRDTGTVWYSPDHYRNFYQL
ncbi:ribonuclease domain-containing protein [Streptosporangium sp. NPDC000239]|uniref:ribonuclease domain-containing protein n=1 Tax=Streptosporangium sp. NPDC000239 TaxID=3154248 RepID=UPI00331B58F9